MGGAKPDFRILEGLRGLAAFVVLLNHARGNLFVGGREYLATNDTILDKLAIGLFQITSLGPNAVIVFFVLSGFSIAHSVTAGGSTGRFYLRRVIRLVPPGLAGLALAWAVRALASQPMRFESYIPQYWSLYHEAIFYAIAPLVVAVGWGVPFAAIATLGYLAGVFVGTGDVPHNFVFQYAFYFAVGALAYHRSGLLQRLIVSRKILSGVSLFFILAMAATIHSFERASFLLAGSFSLLLIANFQHHHITNKPLQHLGAMSYTLYVTHFAAVMLWMLILQRVGWLQGRASASLWLWMTAVPFGLGISYAIYWVVERPAIRALEAMRGRRSEATGVRVNPGGEMAP